MMINLYDYLIKPLLLIILKSNDKIIRVLLACPSIFFRICQCIKDNT